MQTKFAYLSSDKGKTITQDDALTLLRAMGQNPSNKEFYAALDDVKLNNYANITLVQFQSLAQHIWNDEKIEDSLSNAFKKFDKNGDGRISASEFRDLMMNKGEGLTEVEFDEIMELVDQNEDGQISYIGKILIFKKSLLLIYILN